jgi:hypothetical protein
MLNEILVRRRNKFIPLNINEIDKWDNIQYAATIVNNLESYGYTLDKDSFNYLKSLGKSELESIYNELMFCVEKLVPYKIYPAMYVNFPEQVINMKEAELYHNSILHYTGDLLGVRIMPEHPKKTRKRFFLEIKFKVISITKNMEDFFEIFDNLFRSATSISQQDKEDIAWFISSKYFSGYVVRNNVPFPLEKFHHNEVKAFVLAEVFKNSWPKEIFNVISDYTKTATDVLRFAVALCNGDISLKEKTKFKFNRQTRRFILRLLNDLKNEYILEDMKRHRMHWIRLDETLHSFEYALKFPRSSYYFRTLKNDKIVTHRTVIEEGIRDGKITDILANLKVNPGDFARRLCKLLRTCPDYLVVIQEFALVVNQVSTPVLLQLRTVLLQESKEYRSFLVKGMSAKAYVIKNELKEINSGVRNSLAAMIDSVLMNRFSELEPLGNVYLDTELKKYALPMSERSASKSVETIARYSRIPIDENKNIRFFIYWKDMKNQRVDLDLSVGFYNDKWELMSYVSYTNLRDHNLKCFHSGDITSAPKGASEFIDIDINHLKEKGVKYVVPNVYNFTIQPFDQIPLASFGWMERENLNSGEIYEPLSVKNRINLTAKENISVPLVVDIDNKEIIWADLDLSIEKARRQLASTASTVRYNINDRGNNIECNINSVISMLINVVTTVKPNVYTLLELHTIARGKKVDKKEDADVIFSVEEKTHCQLDELMSNYMG